MLVSVSSLFYAYAETPKGNTVNNNIVITKKIFFICFSPQFFIYIYYTKISYIATVAIYPKFVENTSGEKIILFISLLNLKTTDVLIT